MMLMATRGKHNQKINLDYLAGFFDGEGSIFITKILNKRSGNYWYRMCASCGNSDRRPIDELHRLFSPNRKNYLYRPGKKITYKGQYQWLATGNVARKFIEKIKPRLVVKQKQAVLAIKFQEWRNSLPNTGKRRTPNILQRCEEYRQRMRNLNYGYLQPQRLSEETPKG